MARKHASPTPRAAASRGTGKSAAMGPRPFTGKSAKPSHGKIVKPAAIQGALPKATVGSPAVHSDHARGIRSLLTSKSQTTVPRGVRDALRVGPGDALEYEIRGEVATIRRAAPAVNADVDPVLLGFLDMLERDIARHPGRVQTLPAALLSRMHRVIAGVGPIDGDEAIAGPVAL